MGQAFSLGHIFVDRTRLQVMFGFQNQAMIQDLDGLSV